MMDVANIRHIVWALEGKCFYTRGHVMGGSSTINSMMYVRGNRRDYDNWAKLGNEGWSYNEVFPYFIKAENATAAPKLAASRYHGTKGPLHVQYPRYHTKLANDYVKAGKQLGFINRDYNGYDSQDNTVQRIQVNMIGPSRDSASKAYLNPIRNRPNLAVIKNSFVLQILIDSTKKVATGVEYRRNGKTYRIKARKEVILSAGVINSPQLLMLSGIGPKSELEKHGITVVADLSVGKNLQDHITVPLYFLIDKNVSITTDVWRTIKSIKAYARDKKGPLSSNWLEALAFYNEYLRKLPPNILYIFVSFFPVYYEEQSLQGFAMLTTLLTPKSRGTVKLKSSNPYEHPLIDPNYLSVQRDYDTLFRGLKNSLNFIKTPSIRKYSPKIFLGIEGNCTGLLKNNLLKCILEQYSQTEFHPVGTVKMGPDVDKDAVVSPQLLVRGFKNLRVIDASIMPVITRANTNAPTVMIAEKASDIIKRSH